MLSALARNNYEGFPFPGLLEEYFPEIEGQDPDFDEDNFPEEDED